MTNEQTFKCQIPDSDGMDLAEAVVNMPQMGRHVKWCEATAKLDNEKFLLDCENDFGKTKTVLELPLELVKRVSVEIVTSSELHRKAFIKSIKIGIGIGVAMAIVIIWQSGKGFGYFLDYLDRFFLTILFSLGFGLVMGIVLNYVPKLIKIPGNMLEFRFWYDDESFIPVFIEPLRKKEIEKILNEAHPELQSENLD